MRPLVEGLVKDGHNVVLVDPASGAGIFAHYLQQLATDINLSHNSSSSRQDQQSPVEVKAFEIQGPEAALATAMGCPTTVQDSLKGPGLERSTYTGQSEAKLVMVGNPPWLKKGDNPVSA